MGCHLAEQARVAELEEDQRDMFKRAAIESSEEWEGIEIGAFKIKCDNTLENDEIVLSDESPWKDIAKSIRNNLKAVPMPLYRFKYDEDTDKLIMERLMS
jgi:hypothetical protein